MIGKDAPLCATAPRVSGFCSGACKKAGNRV